MNNSFEQKLQQDAQSIKAKAEKRLAKLNFQQQIIQNIETKKFPLKTNFNWYWSVAAAMCLSVLILTTVNDKTPTVKTNLPTPSITIVKIHQKFKNIPNSIETQINQSLLAEQQAIINDLKLLKQQLLSI
jgi:hypothetical protein